jgi:hypothetical protein
MILRDLSQDNGNALSRLSKGGRGHRPGSTFPLARIAAAPDASIDALTNE